MRLGHRAFDPDNPMRGKAWLTAAGVALSVVSLGLMAWMALDVDDDGRSSYSELRAGTSPFLGDTDGDGVADGYELDHGFDPLTSASVPLPGTRSGGAGLSDDTACETMPLASVQCVPADPAEEPEPGPEASELPAGGNGVVASSVVAGTTTLVAGVAARLVSSAILHK